jgi:hypothetical protein
MLLAVMVYKYMVVNNSINVISKQNIVTDICDTGMMKFYQYSKRSFYVQSEDKKFQFFFVYDTNGLQGFSIKDELTDKEIYYNISEKGVLESYMYEDDNYIVKTNIDRDDKTIIQRAEWYKGYMTIYELYTDGSTNITVDSEVPLGWGYTPR